jgi:hypothetical protein
MFALLETSPTNGTLNSFNADGSFTYTPDSLVPGTDTFQYRAYTSGATSTVATVTITMATAGAGQVLLHHTFDTDYTDTEGSYDGTFTAGGDGLGGITNTAQFGTGSMYVSGDDYMRNGFTGTEDVDWSVAFWFKSADTNMKHGVMGDNNASDQINVLANPTQNVEFRKSTSSRKTFSNTSAQDFGWHHYVLTIDGNANANGGEVLAYIDGVQTTTGVWDKTDTGVHIGTIGASNEGTTHAKGLIDEVWVMDYTLSSTEVMSLFNNNSLGGGGGGTNAPATIVSAESAASNTLKIVVSLEAGSVASEYSPKMKTDLMTGSSWDPVAHSDAFDGTFAVTNLDVAADESGDYAIYVKTTNAVEFIQIEADLNQ